MAEVLGTVASGIGVAQLAGSLASSIIKLKGYWDEIKDAPDDISFLAREIDSHHLILRSILESQARITSSGRASDMFLEHSLKLCEDSSNELNELVKALGKEMNSGNKWRSKLGATKVVLKKDQLKRLKKRMKNASKVMNLAITWQTNATLQQQFPVFELKMQASLDQFLINHQKLIPVPPLPSPTTQMSSMNRDITTTSQPQNSECHSNSTPRFVPKDCTSAQIYSQDYSSRWSVYLMGSVDVRKTQQQRNRNRFEETEAKYKPPAWLSNRAWQCMYTRDLSTLRWNFNIQTYRTLDVESDFFKVLRDGDVVGVQEMLANRTAFVNDRFVGGLRHVSFWDEGTPLHIAASNNHLDLCKLLLENGADISSDAARGKTPLGVFIFSVSWDRRHRFQALDHTHALVILRTLIEAGADSELIDQMHILASSTGCPTEMFHYLQQRTLMSSGEISFIDKVYIASRFLVEHGVQSQNVILSYLEDPNFQANVALHRDNIAVKEFFIRACREFSQDNFKDEGMVDLVKKMMSTGISIHTLDDNHETVLQRKIQLCYRRVDVQEGEIWGFETWLGFVVNLGVDLNTYGEVESAIYKKKRMAQDSDEDWLLENILGSKHGPRIEDWDLWAIEWRDEYAGDFWKLIENPLQAALANISIPGEWVD